jgi:hypothetical protein
MVQKTVKETRERKELSVVKKIQEQNQDYQFSYWVFTFNGYEDADINHLEQEFKRICHWYIFQEEIGNGTHDIPVGPPYLQGTLKLKTRARKTQMTPIHTNIQWEEIKSVKAAKCYSQKEATRSGKQWVYGIELYDPVLVDEPRGWQLDVMKILDNTSDDQLIHWFWEPTGCVGKTELCKYLCVKHQASFVGGGTKQNILCSIKKKTPKVMIVDIPRAEYAYVNYCALEAVKDGCIFSGKFEAGANAFTPPHVICFANSPPKIENLSPDRWNVVSIQELMAALTPDTEVFPV